MSGILRHTPGIHTGLGALASRQLFTAEYKSVYDSFTTKPSASVANAQNTMVESLVDSGVWSKFDVFYVFAGHTNDNNESLINWKNPGTNDSTAVNSPVFSQYNGFTGNGLSSYINTNYNPSTDKINLSLNSASFGLYSMTDRLAASKIHGVVSGTDFMLLYPKTTGDILRGYINSTNAKDDSIINSTGLLSVHRRNSTDLAVSKNKTISSYRTDSITDAIPNGDFYLLARNIIGTGASNYDDIEISMAYIGDFLSQSDLNILVDTFDSYINFFP